MGECVYHFSKSTFNIEAISAPSTFTVKIASVAALQLPGDALKKAGIISNRHPLPDAFVHAPADEDKAKYNWQVIGRVEFFMAHRRLHRPPAPRLERPLISGPKQTPSYSQHEGSAAVQSRSYSCVLPLLRSECFDAHVRLQRDIGPSAVPARPRRPGHTFRSDLRPASKPHHSWNRKSRRQKTKLWGCWSAREPSRGV